MTVGFMGCKKGGDDEGEEGEEGEEAAEVNSVKLAKKWPAGQSVTFSKSISIQRQVSKGMASGQERETTYLMSFEAGASLATTVSMKIVGQKMNNTIGGKPFIVFEGKAESDDEEEDMDEDEDEDEDAKRKPRKNPTAEMIKRSVLASLDSEVKLTTDDSGAITEVDGINKVHGRVLRGVPTGMYRLVGGMFSKTIFMEAPMFHAGLTGKEVKKDASWDYSEKGMLLLNWQQDFKFNSTFTGMEKWQDQQVAAFKITGEISGSTTNPAVVAISPGGKFTGKALYSIDLGILIERTISGSFVSVEGGQTTVSNTFTQSFKVASVKKAGGDDEDME